jgi:hypothetical protein
VRPAVHPQSYLEKLNDGGMKKEEVVDGLGGGSEGNVRRVNEAKDFRFGSRIRE